MKIAFLINSMATGGAEKLLLDSIPYYKKYNVNISLILLNGKRYSFFKIIESSKSCKIISLSKGSVYNPILIFKLIQFIKKYDIIHVHLFPANYYIVIAKWLSFSKTKLVFTEHSTNNNRIRLGGIFKLFDKIIYKNFKIIIAINEDVKKSIKKHVGQIGNIRVIQNGINLRVYNTAKAYEKNTFSIYENEKDIFLIQISSFRKAKDQPTVIRALKYLSNNVKLILVGDGPLLENSKKIVKKLKLEKRVEFLGVRKDVPELIKTCDISVLSSKWEGFGLVAVEAMAAKKPLIYSDVPGLQNVVKNAGLIFKPGNEIDLAAKINNLIHDKKLYASLSNFGFELSKKYDINNLVNKQIDIYKTLLQ